MEERMKKDLKRWLKRKVKITLGFVISFMITGTVGFAEFKIEDIEGGKKLTGTNNEDLTKYNPLEHGNIQLKDFKEIHINVKDKSGLKTWSGRFNLPDTDLYITVTGETLNTDGIHLTNHGPYIVLNKYVANIDAPKSDALNMSHDCTHPGDSPVAYSNINYLDVTVKQGHGIRANSSIKDDGETSIRINKSANIEIFGKGKTAVYAGNDEKYFLSFGAESLGKGKIYLNGDNIIKTYGDNSYGIWAGRNGYIEVNNIDIEATGKNSYGIAATNGNISYSGIDNSKNRWGSTVLLKGDTVKVHIPEGKAFLADSQYANISSKDNKEILYDIKGSIEATNNGKISLYAKENSNIEGDILAEKSGSVVLNLDKTTLIGKIDDKRYDSKKTGTVNIAFDGGKWESTGKSFVSEVDLKSETDVTFKEKGTSIDIQNLKGNGNGTFVMGINSENKAEGNMLYIQNSDGGEYTLNLQNSDLSKIEVGDAIRFATIGKDAKNNNLQFKATDVKEQGVKTVSFKVENSDFVVGNEENKIYNDGENKSGNEFVENNYVDGENWYVTRLENTEGTNDIGQTIIEMAKSNYASAVYMDNLNKRLGDMTFADGNEGYWVRVRNDRVGEDEEYRLRNNMTQLGYDKSYPMEEGKGTEHRGLAFEYSQGDMEYKNINGSGDVDRLALWAYDTKVYNNGFYSDYVFRFGRISSEFDINGRETGNNVTGDYDNLFAGLSAEFGKRYDLSQRLYFEPQLQLQYTYIDDVDYTTNQNTKVDYSDINSLIGRVGFRLGYDFYKENSKDNTIYLKADINHEFLGNQNIKAVDLTGELTERYHNDDTWFDFGVGTAKNLTENLYIYGDIERQFGHKDNSWQFNLGFNWKI